MKKQVHQDVFDYMEKWAPKTLAYDWDPVGMQVGSPLNHTAKIVVSLDVTEAVVDEAIAAGANLIIAHHPLLFKPLKNLDVTTQKGRIVQKLVKHDVTVYAAHTNLDIAQGGVNDILAQKLQLQNTKPLVTTSAESLLKLVVYVPKTHTDELREGLGNAGAGHIGNYSHCTFHTPGTGSFMPQEGTNPFIGKTDELTFADEDRLETILKEKDKAEILRALTQIHPYEEAAYDLYPVQQTAESYGLGRIGTLPKGVSLADLCEKAKQVFEIDHLRYVGNDNTRIEKVAVLGGSGEKYIDAAMEAGADVLITGDVSFHPAQDAYEEGMSIIDPGHHIEKWMKNTVAAHLQNAFPELPVISSKVNTEPFRFK